MEHGDRSRRESDGRAERGLLFGLALMVVGTAFLLDRFGVVDVTGAYWPFILIFLGCARLLFPSRSGSRRPGVLFIALGLWGLASEFHLLGLDYDTSWPLLIVIWGSMLVWRSLTGSRACDRPCESER